jgi:ABC-type lipoprotein release transport system permease subunit
MIAFKLAYKNLMGAGLRTLLIVFVLSLAYVLIIYMNGLYQGWDRQARTYDPMTLVDAHAPVPDELETKAAEGKTVPILITQATIYPEGRMMGAMLKGIDTRQKLLSLPTEKLDPDSEEITAIVGSRLAKAAELEVGDYLLVRWRDSNGTFDATDVKISGIFHSAVPAVDQGTVWIPLATLQRITGMPGEASMVVMNEAPEDGSTLAGWSFKGHDFLFKDLEEMIQMKSIGGSIFYIIILALALLAVFDTQVLSIFRRQREIGTYIAMGMTRKQVVGIFTVEGGFHAILAVILGAIYGFPLLLWTQKAGIKMPEGTDEFGMAAAEHMYPYYSLALVIGSVILVTVATTIVSYMPSRKISKMNPNDAIRGKIQ